MAGSQARFFASLARPTFILCGCVAWACVLDIVPDRAVAAETGKVAPTSEVRLKNGWLTVRAHDTLLIDVLDAIALVAGADARFGGDLNTPISLSFGPVPLDRGIRRLVGQHTLVMIQKADEGSPGMPRLSELRVYGPATVQAGPSRRISKADLLKRITQDLAGPNPAHRVVAVQRVSDLERDVALDLLDNVLAEESTLRVHAVAALGRIGGDGATARLERILTDHDRRVRTEVVRALGVAKAQRAMLALGQVVFGNYDAEMRKVAVEGLAARHDKAAAFLEAAAADEDPGVRGAALEALSYRR